MSVFEDEFEKKPNTKQLDLETLSVDELRERVFALKAEIERCEQAIAKKSASLSAANALFSKPKD